MNLETELKIHTINKKTIVTTIFIVFCILILLLTCQTLIMTLSYNKVYDGVYLNNDKVSHLSRTELDQFIENKYNIPLKTAVLTFTFRDMKWKIDASDFNLSINKEDIINKLYSPGHEGGMFKRLSDIVNLRMHNLHVNLFETYSSLIRYDKDKVEEIAEKISKESFIPVAEHQININNSDVIITAGHEGYYIPPDKLRDLIIEALNDTNSFHKDLSEIALVTKPKDLDPNAVAQQLYIPAENAQYAKANNKVIVTQHKYGQMIDEKELKTITDSLASMPDKTFTLSIIKIEPTIKSDQIKPPTFDDVLGQTTTKFSAGDKNRNTNIALAASFINGTYILPGEVFSFNNIIGDTTKEKGYKPAPSYIGGKVVDSYGGGICQVSTTLYNAVIHSGLEVVERSPHSFIVSYVNLGMDAAIAYPYKDMKFKNNTAEPILITAQTTNTSITFKIMGLNHNKNRRYEFKTEILSSTDYKTVYVDDPNLPKGKTSVEQTGTKGYSVKTYRTTYIDGNPVKTELFSSSKYKARDKIIARGTKEN